MMKNLQETRNRTNRLNLGKGIHSQQQVEPADTKIPRDGE